MNGWHHGDYIHLSGWEPGGPLFYHKDGYKVGAH